MNHLTPRPRRIFIGSSPRSVINAAAEHIGINYRTAQRIVEAAVEHHPGQLRGRAAS